MHFWNSFVSGTLLCIVIPLVSTKPVSHSSNSPHVSSVERRALPNLQLNSDQDQTNRVTQAFKDMKTIVSTVLDAFDKHAADPNSPEAIHLMNVFPKYFAPNHMNVVQSIFNTLAGTETTGDQYGASIFSQVTINGDDWLHATTNNPQSEIPGELAVGYTRQPGPTNGVGEIHLASSDECNAYAYPDLDQIIAPDQISADKCRQVLGDNVSYKMYSLGGYPLLHELMHLNIVAQPTLAEAKLDQPRGVPLSNGGTKDIPVDKISDFVYGPQQAGGLIYPEWYYELEGILFPNGPIINADSYPLFASELYWTIKCDYAFDLPTDNRNDPDGVYPTTENPDDIFGGMIIDG